MIPHSFQFQDDTAVVYHANCTDGFAAAFLVWSIYQRLREPRKVHYYACAYGKPLPVFYEQHILVVDFSFSAETLNWLLDAGKKVSIFDHHETAASALNGYGSYHFGNGMNKAEIVLCPDQSGALLALRLQSRAGVELPPTYEKMAHHVSDRDLWEFKSEDTRTWYEMLQMVPAAFLDWEGLLNNARWREQLLVAAHSRVTMRDEMATMVASKHQLVQFAGYQIPVVNAPVFLASEVGSKLAKNHPFALMFAMSAKEAFVSLRSDKDRLAPDQGAVDVEQIAKKFGGGGHKAAAGFALPLVGFVKLLSGGL